MGKVIVAFRQVTLKETHIVALLRISVHAVRVNIIFGDVLSAIANKGNCLFFFVYK